MENHANTSLARTFAPSDLPAGVWHADALATTAVQVQPTGDARLDAELPGGGWPVGALIEILQPEALHGEWRLVLPALARCGQGAVVLVGAPHVPFAPALAAQGLQPDRLLWVQATAPAQRLWAAEQALSCAQVDAVLLWLTPALDAHGKTPRPQHAPRQSVQGAPRSDQLRRLQLVAAEHSKLLFVVRPLQDREVASAAILRLELRMPQVLQPLPEAAQPAAEAGQPTAEAAQPAAGGQGRAGGVPLPPRGSEMALHIHKRRGPPLERTLALRAASSALECLLAAHAYALDRPSYAA
jgi:protein ImuA